MPYENQRSRVPNPAFAAVPEEVAGEATTLFRFGTRLPTLLCNTSPPFVNPPLYSPHQRRRNGPNKTTAQQQCRI